MGAQDYGNLPDYLVNGDNYERVLPDTGQLLVIPGKKNPGPSPLIAPSSECNQPDCYWPIVPTCQPDFGFSGRCALIVHDRATGFYNVAAISDFQITDETCECSIASALGGATDTQDACIATIQAAVDSLTGQAIWGIQAPWLLAELGFPRNYFFIADFWFIACIDPAIVIPNLLRPPPPPPPSQPCCVSYSPYNGGCCIRGGA